MIRLFSERKRGVMLQIACVVLFSIASYLGTYYYTENLLGLFILGVLIAIHIYKKAYSFVGQFIGYVILNSICFLHYYPSPFLKYGVGYEHYFKSVIAGGLCNFLIWVLAIGSLPEKYLKHVFKILPAICLVDCLAVLLTWFTGEPRGIVGASSIDGCLIACTFPFLIRSIKNRYGVFSPQEFISYIIAIVSIFILGGSIAIGCFSIVMMAIIWEGTNLKSNLKLSVSFIMTIAGLSYSIIGIKLFDSSSRFHIYKASFNWWSQYANKFFGTGIGSYWVYGPLIQDQNKWFKSDYFTFMHSDILQILFELGVIGLFLFMIFIVRIIRKTILLRRFYLLGPIGAYLLFMMFYYPLHSFITAFVGAVIYRVVISREDYGSQI